MPRKVEVMRDGRAWVLNDVWTMDRAREVYGVDAARYVGGVLEQEDGGGGWIACDQHYTLDEAKAVTTHPWLAFRLRPYEDATPNEAIRSGGHTWVKCDCGTGLQVLLGVTTICNCGVRWHGKSETEVAKMPPFIVNYGPGEKHKTAEEALAEVIAQGERDHSRAKRVGVEGELAIRALEVKLAEAEGTASGLLDTQNRLADACSRANRLSDECGSLRSELNEAYAKIGRQELELETMRRKVEKKR